MKEEEEVIQCDLMHVNIIKNKQYKNTNNINNINFII